MWAAIIAARNSASSGREAKSESALAISIAGLVWAKEEGFGAHPLYNKRDSIDAVNKDVFFKDSYSFTNLQTRKALGNFERIHTFQSWSLLHNSDFEYCCNQNESAQFLQY